MSKSTKALLVAAGIFAVAGIVILVVVMTVCKWDISALSTTEFQTKSYEISEKFSNISINTESADIIIVSTNDAVCRVECLESENQKHSVSVNGDTLNIGAEENANWFEHTTDLNFKSPKITVYLPKGEYKNLLIKESTGDISIENITTKVLDISVTTGDISLLKISCVNLVSEGSTGDISINNVIAAGKISVVTRTGDVSFYDSDAGEISAETSTGDISGTLLSEKIFISSTSTGSINLPKTSRGGKCELKTSTGDISIRISKT